MKKLLMASNGEHLSTASLRTAFVLLLGVALSSSFWMAPTAHAADPTPRQMIESQLPEGKTLATASKSEFLAAVCEAVKKWRNAAPQIVKAAINAHPEWTREIVRTAIRCLGTDDCELIARTVNGATKANPDDASGIVDLALELAPNCRDAIGGSGPGTGQFTNPPINQNPPPGSIGGGGGGFQETRVTVCNNGTEVFVFSSQLAQFLASHPGAFVGACQPTPDTNR